MCTLIGFKIQLAELAGPDCNIVLRKTYKKRSAIRHFARSAYGRWSSFSPCVALCCVFGVDWTLWKQPACDITFTTSPHPVLPTPPYLQRERKKETGTVISWNVYSLKDLYIITTSRNGKPGWVLSVHCPVKAEWFRLARVQYIVKRILCPTITPSFGIIMQLFKGQWTHACIYKITATFNGVNLLLICESVNKFCVTCIYICETLLSCKKTYWLKT